MLHHHRLLLLLKIVLFNFYSNHCLLLSCTLHYRPEFSLLLLSLHSNFSSILLLLDFKFNHHLCFLACFFDSLKCFFLFFLQESNSIVHFSYFIFSMRSHFACFNKRSYILDFTHTRVKLSPAELTLESLIWWLRILHLCFEILLPFGFYFLA